MGKPHPLALSERIVAFVEEGKPERPLLPLHGGVAGRSWRFTELLRAQGALYVQVRFGLFQCLRCAGREWPVRETTPFAAQRMN